MIQFSKRRLRLFPSKTDISEQGFFTPDSDQLSEFIARENEGRSKVVTLDFSASTASYDFSELNNTLINYSPHFNDYVGNTFRCFIAASMREMDAIKLKWNRTRHYTIEELFDDIIEQLRMNNADMIRVVNLITQVRKVLVTGCSNNLFETQILNVLTMLDIMRQQVSGGTEAGAKWVVFCLHSGYIYRSPYAESLKEIHYLISGNSAALGIEFVSEDSQSFS
ncbi:hypothetical protein L3Q72_18370 [Vibrio sp. JC009]|uniref:hypothetical protein n=1 Tax=Vibrio sp. JC009 TaxID=2912314 RepID=UPI0023AF7439|nr:hypothetical protein [Vibrio sp. JC009]WED24840.1 hypothetical protein L3Q72_18370 [Vibrio sp. JC009]